MKHGSTVGRNNQRALRRMYCFKPMGEFRVEEQGQALHLTLIAQHSNGVIQKVTEGLCLINLIKSPDPFSGPLQWLTQFAIV
jgi:hypothetical protein